MENKCEKIGFVHAWNDITPHEIYLTYPVKYPPKTEKCLNCGLVRKFITTQCEVKEWQYEPRKNINTSVDSQPTDKN